MGYEKVCGDYFASPVPIAGGGGVIIPFEITGGDHTTGGTVDQIIDMTTQAGDYIPTHVAADGTFRILIEVAAPIVVQLMDNSSFTISQAMADAYLGTWVPMAIKKVFKAGSTGTFSAGR